MPGLNGLSILFAGSGAFGAPTLRRLVDRGASVVRVFTQPAKPAGRGKSITPTPIGALANELGLPLTETADINLEPLPSADLLVVIAFGQKLAPHVVDHARLGAINLHASRLPRYRGAAPINWAVINGDPTTGNSVIRLAQRMDAGAVLGMSEVPIGALDTAGEIHDRLSLDGPDLVERVLFDLARGAATPIEQDHTQATKAVKLSRDLSRIDWNRDATAIANQIRGMHPWPGCRARLLRADGTEVVRLTLVRARVTPAGPLQRTGLPVVPPGTLLEDGTIQTGSGALDLIELQPDGKKPMTLATFRNGKRWTPGLRLESIQ
jgi:methionyl-tRNA formyltransferase